MDRKERIDAWLYRFVPEIGNSVRCKTAVQGTIDLIFIFLDSDRLLQRKWGDRLRAFFCLQVHLPLPLISAINRRNGVVIFLLVNAVAYFSVRKQSNSPEKGNSRLPWQNRRAS